MRIFENSLILMIVIVLLVIGCAPNIPKSDYLLQIKRSFRASFDKTWDSVLEVVKTSKGTIITKDKSSGLIVYSIIDSKSKTKVYMNIYLKNHPTTNITVVYLTPWVRTGYYFKEIDKDFFSALEKILERR